MRITRIERVALHLPYKERVREHLRKGWNLGNRATDEEFEERKDEFHRQWRESSPPSVQDSLYWVHTDEDLIGLGEGVALPDDQLQTYVGRSPFEFIMDDSPGPLQMAFYDLMGQFLGLPIARLLGPSRESAPLAYWSQCFPPETMQQEAKIALEMGFKMHKFKRRAHTDVVEQVAAIAEVTPEDYELTIDANQTFGTLERALAVGRELKRYPQVHCLESPIPQGDIEGYRALKRELGYPLAHHMGNPEPIAALHSDVYDYFILGARVANTTRNAHICAARNKPFWMQLGTEATGISVLFMLHMAAAIPNATLAHVSLFLLLEHQLLQEPLKIENGQVIIPDKPGLGADLDLDAVERYRI